jgi:phosphoglucosamine mutase
MQRYPQAKANVPVEDGGALSPSLFEEAERLAGRAQGHARALVRPSGTEPVVRILAEAETEQEARRLCATIRTLVERELG